MHGPCKVGVCLEDNKCKKRFPKDHIEATKLNQNGYHIYKRSNDGTNIIKNGHKFNNQDVVPHNLYLATKYNAHINVEVCSSVTAVKYLYKYVYKGHDKVTFGFSKDSNEEHVDEIQNYLDARFVTASEAAWRLLGLPMCGQYPKTNRLTIHLENKQTIIFKETEKAQEIISSQENLRNKTQLTEYFKFNQTNQEKILYSEMPNHCVWKADSKTWTKRKYVYRIQNLYN